MAFPTIPTAAAGRLLSTTQANTTAARTFPNLSDLTKNSGDLLIAIVVAYQTTATADAAFGSWGGGFTEFADRSSSTTMAIGCAYKWSTGSETGTFTVTQANTVSGHAATFLLSIPGAHATTPPEAGAKADGTGAAADPASFNPTGWDAEDALWIAVGASGETGTGGAYTGIASAPANFGDYADSGMSADAVGAVEGAVAFRQLNAASADVGTFSLDTSNARNSALVIAVRPAPPEPTDTAVARVSLAGGDTPTVRTGHSLNIRARKASGTGTVTMRAALYEGANNRSGDLESSALTTSLATKSLPIAEADAEDITDYSDLEVRFWGYSSTGDTVAVEVAELWIEVPAGNPSPEITAVPAAASAVGVAPSVSISVAAVPAAASASAVAPVPGVSIAPPPAAAAASGVAPALTLTSDADVAALPAAAVAVGVAPTLSTSEAITATPALAAAAGVAPVPAISITAPPAQAVSAGVPPAISASTDASVAATPAAASATGVAPVPEIALAAPPAQAMGVGGTPTIATSEEVLASPATAAAVGVAPVPEIALGAAPALAAATGVAPTVTAGTGVAITATPAAASAVGVAPAISYTAEIAATPAPAAAVGVAPVISTGTGVSVTATPALAAASGVAPTLSTSEAISATPALSAALGVPPVPGIEISAPPAAAGGSGVAPALSASPEILAVPALAAATGVAPSLTVGGNRTIPVGPALAAAVGVAPSVTATISIEVVATPALASATVGTPTLSTSEALVAVPAAAAALGVAPVVAISILAVPASAGAAGVAPTITIGTDATILAVPALASGIGVAPLLDLTSTYSPPPAIAAASGVAPLIEVRANAPPALADALAVVPLVGITISAPPARASSSAPRPTVVGGRNAIADYIPEDELARMRAEILDTLGGEVAGPAGTAVIYRATATAAALGPEETWRAIGTASCRFAPERGTEETAGGALTANRPIVVTLPHSVTVRDADRLAIAGTTYQITSVEKHRAYDLCRRVRAEIL